MISRIFDKFIETIPDEDKEYMKSKINDYVDKEALKLAKSRHVEVTEDIINEVISKMGSLQDFIDENFKDPEDYTWALNSIVHNEFCAKCGTCSIVCPNNLIEFTDTPHLVQECRRDGNGMCMEVCPRMGSARYQISIRENFKE